MTKLEEVENQQHKYYLRQFSNAYSCLRLIDLWDKSGIEPFFYIKEKIKDNSDISGSPRLILSDCNARAVSAAYLFNSFSLKKKPRNPGYFKMYELIDLKFDKVSEARMFDSDDAFNFACLSDRYDPLIVDIDTIRHAYVQEILMSLLSQYDTQSIIFVCSTPLNELKTRMPDFVEAVQNKGKLVEFWKKIPAATLVSKYIFFRKEEGKEIYFFKRDDFENKVFSKFTTEKFKEFAQTYSIDEETLKNEILAQMLSFE